VVDAEAKPVAAMSLILASQSPFRARILHDAGLNFSQVAAEIDERSVELPLSKSGATPEDIAMVLAEAKALDVSERHRHALVIGCDQVLSLGDAILHKCKTMEEARKRLLALSGNTHHLNSAIVLARHGKTIWRHMAVSVMIMRRFDAGFVGRHLAQAGEGVLGSVGAYQYEGIGIQLFEKTEGDYFSIIGLPLLPLLEQLRQLGEIDG
jgi:septum formation protein